MEIIYDHQVICFKYHRFIRKNRDKTVVFKILPGIIFHLKNQRGIKLKDNYNFNRLVNTSKAIHSKYRTSRCNLQEISLFLSGFL